MKKILIASIALVVIGGIAFTTYKIDAKSFKKNKSYNVENIANLKVYTDSWDLRFKKSNSNEVTISAEGKQEDKAPVTFHKDGENLVIEQKAQKSSGFLGGFTFGKRGGTIYINVPETGINNVEVANKDGNIQMSDISVDNILVDNNSGDEKIKGVSANTGKFSSMDGSLNAENSYFEDLNITSISGDNYIKDIESSNVKVTSKDGAVSIRDITEGESLTVDTTTGDIGLSYKKAPTSLTVFAKSNSDIKLTLDELRKSNSGVKSIKGEIGRGANKLNLTSEDGAINVTN
ncbi:DUF4097 family beta strand repeat-containing protein [Bacillus sp. C28GYM-DRY-1]|uniref:DUF4097 family beta strand repeat-containing protein n=1 Tax=Bacillus sp. C28GYM-DRY-1 TaxID=3062686 RepID=UPI0026748C4F|nr:DUF4097 family beta strand repeat-containing protein [Bacillus sp. C28GYM-DRY-1]MDO3662774.1 DUF4097 family beta strand repeat-containing protein [Bacillus sp. C28GYM-DRY-1]